MEARKKVMYHNVFFTWLPDCALSPSLFVVPIGKYGEVETKQGINIGVF